jgi:hypothetical protein
MPGLGRSVQAQASQPFPKQGGGSASAARRAIAADATVACSSPFVLRRSDGEVVMRSRIAIRAVVARYTGPCSIYMKAIRGYKRQGD